MFSETWLIPNSHTLSIGLGNFLKQGPKALPPKCALKQQKATVGKKGKTINGPQGLRLTGR